MKKIYSSLILLVFCCNTGLLAQIKMGYFDLQKILPQIPAFQAAQKDMETYQKQIEAEVKSKQEEYQTKLQAYQDGVKSNSFTPAMIQAKEKELQSLQQQYQAFQQTIQDDAQKREQNLMAPIYEKIEAAINKIAETGGYKYIIKSEFVSGAGKSSDISNMVLKEMGITPKPE